MYIHSSGEIWMATPVGVVRYDPVTDSFMPTIDRLDGLIGNRVNDIVEDNGKLFLSHNGAGPTRPGASVYNLTTNNVDLIYKIDQVPSNTITALSADSWGIHIATDQEPIVHYNMADNQFEDGASTWQSLQDPPRAYQLGRRKSVAPLMTWLLVPTGLREQLCRAPLEPDPTALRTALGFIDGELVTGRHVAHPQ